MALINCSECSKEISNKAAACPHCGNPVNTSVVFTREKYRETNIEHSPPNIPTGTALIIGGVLLLIFGLIFLIIFFIIGIPSILFGITMLVKGVNMVSGELKATCPYCNKPCKPTKTAINFKCPYCHKLSVRHDDKLKATE